MNHSRPERRTARSKPLDAEGLRNYALKILGGRALSISELRERLKRRAGEGVDVEAVIAQLKEYGYLNDAQFAESFAAARRDVQGLGRMRVLRDLRARRVAPKVAEEAVTDAFAEVDEVAQIEQYLARKFRGKNLPDYLSEEKNLAAAYRRLRYAGFSTGNSIRVLKRYASRADELTDDPEDDSEPRP